MAGCASVRSSALSPACSRAGALLAGCGSRTRPTTSTASRAKTARRRRRATFPAPEGRSLAELLEAADPADARRLAGGVRLLRGREPLSLRRLQEGPEPGHRRRSRPLLRAGPRGQPESRKRERQRRRRPGQEKALEEPATGPFPARVESLVDPARLPRPDDQRRPRRGHRRLLDPDRLPERRRVADRRRDQGRRRADRHAAAERHRRRGQARADGGGEGAADPHADRRRTSAATCRN